MGKLSQAALYFYNNGENCCDAILKGAEYKYGLYIPDEEYRAFKGFSNGYGVGGMCAALNGAVAVLGMLFDEDDVKTLRLELLNGFMEKYGSFNCSSVMNSVSGGCEAVIKDVSDILEDVISGRQAFIRTY